MQIRLDNGGLVGEADSKWEAMSTDEHFLGQPTLYTTLRLTLNRRLAPVVPEGSRGVGFRMVWTSSIAIR